MTTLQPNTSQLRQSLDRAFNDSGFAAFCFDYFPTVYDRLSSGMRKDEKVLLLLDHCRRRPSGFETLFESLRKEYGAGEPDREHLKPVIEALEVYMGLSGGVMEVIEGDVESEMGRRGVTTSNFLKLLSPALQKTFFDSKSAVGEGAVVAFAGGVLEVASRRVRRRFKQPTRKAALERVVQISLAAGLLYLQDCGKAEGDGLQSFGRWLGAEEVLSEFSLLLAPNEEEALDIELLADEFEAAGYSAEFLSSVPFSDLVLDMVGAFYMAVEAEVGLQEAIKIDLLQEMAQKMGALARIEALEARLVAVSQEAGDQLALIRRQLEQQEIGQALTNELLQKIEALLRQTREEAMREQLRIYQTIETSLARVYEVSLEEGKRLEGIRDSQVAAQLEPVLGLLGEIRDQLSSQKALDGAQLAQMEQSYRQTVFELFETLTFKGISPSGRAIALPLVDVYVELKAVADVPEAADTYSAEERRLLVEAEEEGFDEDALRIQLDSLRYERWKERGRQPAQTLQRRSIQEILTDPAQGGVVILGDPGSGKTTLLHYLALQSARLTVPLTESKRLPIFVPLAAYDDYLSRGENHLSLGDFLPLYYEKWRSLPGLAPLFEQALAEGRAFLLLDGLDEVLERSRRLFVASQVEGLIQQWGAKGNRFALTSRVVGYREAPLAGNLPHVTVLDFGRHEIERFTEQWCYAYERWVAGGKETSVVKERAEREKEALLSDVRSNPSIERLAASPLLLTMLALLRRQVGQLPDRRIELYERYVRTLIDNWQEARSQGARQEAPLRFDPHRAIAHLIEVALWLQQHKASGTASRHELDRILEEICLRYEGHDLTSASPKALVQAQQEAERFRKDMRHLAGLLVERGRDAFGFLHLTFQEYFVGRAVARMNPEERWKTINPHLHIQRWREPIMLCAGQLGIIEQRRPLVDAYITAILNAKSPHEAILHRDLFLATDIAADDVGLSPPTLNQLAQCLIPLQKSNIPTVRDTALRGLAQLARLRDEEAMSALLESLKHKELQLYVMVAVKAVLAAEACQPLQDALCGQLDDSNELVRWAAVEGLSAQAASNVGVRDALCQKLDDPDPVIRQAAVKGLSAVAASDVGVRDALYQMLDDRDSDVRQAAVQGLSPLAASSEKIVDALYLKLDDPDSDLRQAAVQGLSPLAASSEKVASGLYQKLDDPDSDLRQAAVQALSAVAASSEKVTDALYQKLDDPHSDVRQATVQALSPLAASSESVRDALYQKLDDPHSDVRQAAVQGLAPLIGEDNKITSCLVPWLAFVTENSFNQDHGGQETRRLLANAYAPLLANEIDLLSIIVEILDSPAWPARQGAGWALIAMPGGPPEHLMDKIWNIISDPLGDNSWPERLQVAELFINHRDSALSQRAIAVTVEALDFATQPWYYMPDLGGWVRKQAAQILGKLEPIYRDEQIFQRLARLLEEDEDEEVRDAAYGALLRLAAAPEG